jgi:hypothetical protein
MDAQGGSSLGHAPWFPGACSRVLRGTPGVMKGGEGGGGQTFQAMLGGYQHMLGLWSQMSALLEHVTCCNSVDSAVQPFLRASPTSFGSCSRAKLLPKARLMAEFSANAISRPRPGTDVAAVSPVPAQMWQR